MVCVAVGGIQAKRAAVCLQGKEVGAGPSLRAGFLHIKEMELCLGLQLCCCSGLCLGLQSSGTLHVGRG